MLVPCGAVFEAGLLVCRLIKFWLPSRRTVCRWCFGCADAHNYITYCVVVQRAYVWSTHADEIDLSGPPFVPAS